jgi:hypothetical protein
MLLPPHLYPHHRHPRTHTRRHHWYTGQTYNAHSPPNSALIHHRLAMVLPSNLHLHLHRRHHRPHICRQHRLPEYTSRDKLQAMIAGWRCGWYPACPSRHGHLRKPHCLLVSRNSVRHPCN